MILASQSPRRAEILSMLGFDFEIDVADCDENVDGIPTEQIVAVLARRKAQAVAERHPDEVVIGSDTLVTVDGSPIGKPKDAADAKRMLRLLSGRSHTVYTGVSIIKDGVDETFVVSAEVEFYPLTDAQIDRYVATGEPLDKAGAYGIQGRGALLVRGIKGDFFTVMGLPAAEVTRRLEAYEIYPTN